MSNPVTGISSSSPIISLPEGQSELQKKINDLLIKILPDFELQNITFVVKKDSFSISRNNQPVWTVRFKDGKVTVGKLFGRISETNEELAKNLTEIFHRLSNQQEFASIPSSEEQVLVLDKLFSPGFQKIGQTKTQELGRDLEMILAQLTQIIDPSASTQTQAEQQSIISRVLESLKAFIQKWGSVLGDADGILRNLFDILVCSVKVCSETADKLKVGIASLRIIQGVISIISGAIKLHQARLAYINPNATAAEKEEAWQNIKNAILQIGEGLLWVGLAVAFLACPAGGLASVVLGGVLFYGGFAAEAIFTLVTALPKLNKIKEFLSDDSMPKEIEKITELESLIGEKIGGKDWGQIQTLLQKKKAEQKAAILLAFMCLATTALGFPSDFVTWFFPSLMTDATAAALGGLLDLAWTGINFLYLLEDLPSAFSSTGILTRLCAEDSQTDNSLSEVFKSVTAVRNGLWVP